MILDKKQNFTGHIPFNNSEIKILC